MTTMAVRPIILRRNHPSTASRMMMVISNRIRLQSTATATATTALSSCCRKPPFRLLARYTSRKEQHEHSPSRREHRVPPLRSFSSGDDTTITTSSSSTTTTTTTADSTTESSPTPKKKKKKCSPKNPFVDVCDDQPQFMKTSTLDDDEEEDPAKNLGTIVGAWVFCRHGDRTPSRALCPPHRVKDEAHFWLTKLPYPSTAYAYKEFCASFPPLIDDPTGNFMDVHRNPYGFLTHKGLLQCHENGRLLRQRYDPNYDYHHDNDPFGGFQDKSNSNNHKAAAERADDDFLKRWRISAYSTNYLRTVLSVQSLLDGLLHTQLYAPSQTRDDMDFTAMRPQEWPVPDHNFMPTSNDNDNDTMDDMDEDDGFGIDKMSSRDDDNEYKAEGYGSDWEADPRNNPLQLYLSKNSSSFGHGANHSRPRPKVFVRVRDQSCDNLNAFDRNPDLMRDLVGDVMKSPGFIQVDSNAAPIAARLANILPGLARKGRKDFSAKTPSGINWVEAADHFVCRTSHQLALSKFSDFEHDENVEQMLSAMTYKALGHLAWRFRQWYQNPQLLAAIAAPPLREIAQQLEHLVSMSSATKSSSSTATANQNFLCIYSCHDVTLLSLLYALGADFLADEESAVWREYWPAYASTLVIELVRLDDDDDASNKENRDPSADHRHVMRVLINGRIVTSTDFLLNKFESDKASSSTTETPAQAPPANPIGKGPHQLLTTEDFWSITGEYDFTRWPAMKDERGSSGKSKKPRTTGSLNSSLN